MIPEKLPPSSRRENSPKTQKNNSSMALKIDGLFDKSQPIKRLSMIKLNPRELNNFLSEAL